MTASQMRDINSSRNATLEFLSLTGTWVDEKTAEEIIADIRGARKSKTDAVVLEDWKQSPPA